METFDSPDNKSFDDYDPSRGVARDNDPEAQVTITPDFKPPLI